LSNLDDSFFCPTAKSGDALRSRFNNDFADSLEYLLSVCRPHVSFDVDSIDVVLSRIRAGSRETPILYNLHFELVDALQANDLETAAALLTRIADETPAPQGISIVALGLSDDGRDAQVSIPYFCEQDTQFTYSSPMVEPAERTRSVLLDAINDLHWFAPGLAAEMEALVSTVILARGTVVDQAEPAEFESVTALRAFSGVLFNAHSEASSLQCAISLIHESAHMALFAYSPSEGVVTNPPTERYTSPLRTDARPVEGIFHQSFVLARMIYGMDMLRSAPEATAARCDFADSFVVYNIPRFNDAVETLHKHASLTPQGAKALEASRDFVKSLG